MDEHYFPESNYDSLYYCLLMNFQNGEVVDVLPDRRKQYLMQYFSSIKRDTLDYATQKSELNRAKYLSIDLHEPFRDIAATYFPKALVCADSFHVLEHLTDCFRKVRLNCRNRTENETLQYLLSKFKFVFQHNLNLDNEPKYNRRLGRYLNYRNIRDMMFSLNIVQNIALRAKGEKPKRIAYFSLEMSGDQLVQRMICTEADAGMGMKETKNDPDANTTLWNRLWEAAAKLDEAQIFIDDTPGLSILELRSRARRLMAEGGLDLIVIDYLQLMQGNVGRKGNDNRQQEVTAISRGLKALTLELKVPVLALSQLSRSVELRQVKQPMLSDLRESGSLEQDADIVLFLYREDYYKRADDAPSHITELIVAKHRNGPTGRVTLFFKEDCTKFINLSRKKKGNTV